MEPITAAIVAALAKLSEPAIKDAYDGLKSLIARKFGRENKVTRAIAEVESNPESEGRKAVLNEEVVAAKPSADTEIMAAVKTLLDRLEQAGAPVASVRVEAKGERSVAIGRDATGATIRTGDEGSGRKRK
jgi:hypothetical protein